MTRRGLDSQHRCPSLLHWQTTLGCCILNKSGSKGRGPRYSYRWFCPLPPPLLHAFTDILAPRSIMLLPKHTGADYSAAVVPVMYRWRPYTSLLTSRSVPPAPLKMHYCSLGLTPLALPLLTVPPPPTHTHILATSPVSMAPFPHGAFISLHQHSHASLGCAHVLKIHSIPQPPPLHHWRLVFAPPALLPCDNPHVEPWGRCLWNPG